MTRSGFLYILTLIITICTGCDLLGEPGASKINSESLLAECMEPHEDKDRETGYKNCLFAVLWMDRVNPETLMHGNALEKLGDYTLPVNPSAAIDHYKASYDLRERLNENRTNLSNLLLKLSNALNMQGRWADSEITLQQALAKIEPIVGPDSVEAADILNRIGITQLRQNQPLEAEKSLNRAMLIREVKLRDDPQLAETYNNIGYLKQLQNDNRGAEMFYQRAAEIQQAAYQIPYPELFDSLSNLANLQAVMGKTQDAEKNWNKLLAVTERGFGRESNQYAVVLNSLGLIAMLANNYIIAENQFSQARLIFEKKQGLNSLQTADAAYNHALALVALGRRQDAIAPLRYATSYAQLALGVNNPVSQKRMNNLVNLEASLTQQ